MSILFSRVFSALLAFILSFFGVTSGTITNKSQNFRIVAYIVGNNLLDFDSFDVSHMGQITDAILIGVGDFDTSGEVQLCKNFDTIYENLRKAAEGTDVRIHLNLGGPGCRIESDDWNERMINQSYYHNLAFNSGKLEMNLFAVLEKYDFDGIFFDYEYPVQKSDWNVFGEFLVSLDACLGDDYIIGAAISPWICEMSRKHIKALDYVEVMAYDIWDSKGNHAPYTLMKQTAREAERIGFSKSQIDIGVPFYARPTNKDAYWYDYAGWYDKLDENGLVYDETVGLTFSFNTPEVIYKKTAWAINNGLGGVMVWHYSCDVPADNEKSLFNAMYEAKQKSINCTTGVVC